MADHESTMKYRIEISELKKNITDANRSIREAQSEFRAASSSMEDWQHTSEGLEAKIKSLNKVYDLEKEKLKAIQRQLELTEEKYGKNSTAAENLRIRLNNQQAQVNKTRFEIQRFEKGLHNLEVQASDTSSATDEMTTKIEEAEKTAGKTDGYTMAKDVMSNLVTDGIEAVTSKVFEMTKELAGAETACNNFATKTGQISGKYDEVIEKIYGNSYGENRLDISNAMAEVQQQTNELNPTKLQEMTENALLLSDAYGFEVKESIRTANMLMNQFGVESDTAFSLIIQGVQAGLDKNGDLLDTINEYSVHYKQQGYSVTEFFNSLINGASSGTFSVDKLGDTMKEFGIRTKDTSDTTADVFSMLGYGSAASTEDISELESEIAELEKNLKYAQIEQQNFNESTGELTRIKNSDKIEEYTNSLNEARNKLAELSSKSNDTEKSISDLQAEFAEGGTSAREATQEVLTRLFEMDDKVAQNQAGVALFGTMWEDLGKDGVKALMNVNGQISDSTDALKEVKDIKYDDVQTEITALFREIETEFVKPLVEEWMPEIRNGVDWVSDNLPTIIPTLSTIAGIIAGMWTITKVGNFVSALTSLATPAGIAMLTIGGVATAIAGVAYAIENSDFKPLSDVQEHIDKVNELKDSYANTKKEIDKLATSNGSEFQYYQNLWEELKKITDENGKIKDGYEERARFITEKLSDITDEEIEIVGKSVQEYDKLKTNMEGVLKLKQAESLLSSYEGSYQEAITQKGTAETTYNDILLETDKYRNLKAEADTKIKDYENQLSKLDFNNPAHMTEIAEISNKLEIAQRDSANAYRILYEGENALETKLKEAESLLVKYDAIIQNYENTSQAVLSEDTKGIEDALNKIQHSFITAEIGTKEILERQVKEIESKYDKMQKSAQIEGAKVNKEELNNLKKLLDSAKDELAKVGKETADNYVDAFSQNVKSPMNLQELKTSIEEFNNNVSSPDGKKTADNYVDAFSQNVKSPPNLQKLKASIEEFNNNISQLNGQNPGEQLAHNTLQGYSNTMDVNSPSREMQKLGEYTTEGLTIGINKKSDELYSTTAEMADNVKRDFSRLFEQAQIERSKISLSSLDTISSNMGASNTVVNNNYYYTINQTNTSPEPLSDLEIYRNTKNIFTGSGFKRG